MLEAGIVNKDKPDFFLLKPKDKALLDGIEGLFRDLPLGHSHYQIRHFILGQFPTPDRQYRQALLEIHTRYQSLLDLHYRYRKTELEMEEERINQEEAQYKLDNVAKDDFERRRLDIAYQKAGLEIAMREIGMVNIKKGICETMREIWDFKEEMDRLALLRKYPGNYEQAEPEYWQQEYLKKFIQGKRGENLPPIPETDRLRLLNTVQEEIKKLETQGEGKTAIQGQGG